MATGAEVASGKKRPEARSVQSWTAKRRRFASPRQRRTSTRSRSESVQDWRSSSWLGSSGKMMNGVWRRMGMTVLLWEPGGLQRPGRKLYFSARRKHRAKVVENAGLGVWILGGFLARIPPDEGRALRQSVHA